MSMPCYLRSLKPYSQNETMLCGPLRMICSLSFWVCGILHCCQLLLTQREHPPKKGLTLPVSISACVFYKGISPGRRCICEPGFHHAPHPCTSRGENAPTNRSLPPRAILIQRTFLNPAPRMPRPLRHAVPKWTYLRLPPSSLDVTCSWALAWR
ncbi:hypothetical protein BC936DRAFT_140498 [Jimgerdemannia flammicorona]|uniref:Uncharacterized protein n=1 Tax=Jimgerdemannia flammicorona TaxID=994334 RepID=A0A433ASI9_9FUNG|nr:hypothetical protein BC936DRAFT_140498 [Jimgerdemannia flammicorona]